MTERARITGALRGWALVVWAGGVSDVPDLVKRSDAPVTAAIVSAHDGRSGDVAAVVRRLATVAPDVPVVAHCRTGLQHAADVRKMAAAGAHEFMFAGVDDDGVAIRNVIASAQRARAAEAVSAAVRPLLSERMGAVVEACVRHPAEARTVAGLARLLGVHRKTLLNHSAREGGPPPSRLVAWCRLMLSAHLLATTGETVEWVALELDYPSATALRNAMKRNTGLRASEVARSGGLARVAREFRRRLR
jgi:AraC-like DNA-binding protein